ncbi:hypothetical protein [Streptomyces sp. NPDC093261]|uniref:hypothetical protein n=1 Tax=Streptomyces sp. NPDC093261 TaxID=3366037 RepID=UPI003803D0AE
MQEWRVSALPVPDEGGRVVGVVSEADLLPKEEYSEGDLGQSGQVPHIAEVRTSDAVTAGEPMTAPAAAVDVHCALSGPPRHSGLDPACRTRNGRPVPDGGRQHAEGGRTDGTDTSHDRDTGEALALAAQPTQAAQ